MTFDLKNFYGGRDSHRYTANNETFQVPPGERSRVWMLESDDLAGPFNFDLPDATSILQDGWIVFFIVNITTGGTVSIRDEPGVGLGTLPNGQVAEVGIRGRATANGEWVVNVRLANILTAAEPNFTVNFGSDQGTENETETYAYATDTWTTRTVVPILAGVVTPKAISAVRYLDTSGPSPVDRCYWHYDVHFFEYASDAHVAKSSAGTGEFSGMARMLDGFDGIYHLTPQNFGSVAEGYDTALDSWTTLASPGTVFNDHACDSATPFLLTRLVYNLGGEPDSAVAIDSYNPITDTYIFLPLLPFPQAHFAVSMVGVGAALFVQNGSFNANADPKFSTNAHFQFDPSFNVWRSEPQTPVIARGMGVARLSNVLDRYTFGMGADDGYPGSQSVIHQQYKVFPRTYSSRGVFAWGDRDRRENSWATVESF